MGFLTNMTSAQVTLNATALEKRPTNFLYNTLIQNSSATLGTVPAGKKWTILGYTLSAYGDTAGNGEGFILANSNKIAAVTMLASATERVSHAHGRTFDYNQAPQIAAGQTIVLQSTTTGCTINATVQVIEESV